MKFYKTLKIYKSQPGADGPIVLVPTINGSSTKIIKRKINWKNGLLRSVKICEDWPD